MPSASSCLLFYDCHSKVTQLLPSVNPLCQIDSLHSELQGQDGSVLGFPEEWGNGVPRVLHSMYLCTPLAIFVSACGISQCPPLDSTSHFPFSRGVHSFTCHFKPSWELLLSVTLYHEHLSSLPLLLHFSSPSCFTLFCNYSFSDPGSPRTILLP